MATIDYPLVKCYSLYNYQYIGKYDIYYYNKSYNYNNQMYSKLLSDFLYKTTQNKTITIDDLLSGVYE